MTTSKQNHTRFATCWIGRGDGNTMLNRNSQEMLRPRAISGIPLALSLNPR